MLRQMPPQASIALADRPRSRAPSPWMIQGMAKMQRRDQPAAPATHEARTALRLGGEIARDGLALPPSRHMPCEQRHEARIERTLGEQAAEGKFGSLKATRKASAIGPAPRSAAIIMSRTKTEHPRAYHGEGPPTVAMERSKAIQAIIRLSVADITVPGRATTLYSIAAHSSARLIRRPSLHRRSPRPSYRLRRAAGRPCSSALSPSVKAVTRSALHLLQSWTSDA